jgi:predicted amidophosphoribosyltransferase
MASMRVNLSHLEPPPAGFGDCRVCAYRDKGTAAICYTCALERLDPIPERQCGVCQHPLDPGASCENWVCRRMNRGFGRIWAISLDTGRLEEVIRWYKFGRRDWRVILGRLLAGYLDDHAKEFSQFDLIVASPTFTGPGAVRSWDHIGGILRAADLESAFLWPVDTSTPPAIVQTVLTERFAKQPSWQHRRSLAEGPFRAALSVPDPSRIAGRQVLVFDDIFTEACVLGRWPTAS